MSNKRFFSLIHGGDIHLAPGVKRIPAAEFSSLMKADETLRSVQKDAEQYRLEIAKECEALKEQAEKAGFEAGFNEWAEQVAMLEAEIKQVREDVEKVVIPVALKAAKKIVKRELEVSENAIVDIVSHTLKSVAQHKKVVIYVNPEEQQKVEAHRSRLKDIFENLEAFSIRPRNDIGPGGCVVETEAGIINAQLDNQWIVLENAFAALLNQPVNEEKQAPEKKVSKEETEEKTTQSP